MPACSGDNVGANPAHAGGPGGRAVPGLFQRQRRLRRPSAGLASRPRHRLAAAMEQAPVSRCRLPAEGAPGVGVATGTATGGMMLTRSRSKSGVPVGRQAAPLSALRRGPTLAVAAEVVERDRIGGNPAGGSWRLLKGLRLTPSGSLPGAGASGRGSMSAASSRRHNLHWPAPKRSGMNSESPALW